MEPTRVIFNSDGLTLVGHLRVPAAGGGARRPALVFTGPFTGVKEQVTGLYASRLAERGYVTLAFDHRNFGESEGAPRQHENGAGKLNDLMAATSLLATHPAVDPARLGICGICLGGGYALRYAAFDPRIKAAVLVAGGYNDPHAMQQGMGVAGYRQTLLGFAETAQRQYQTGEVEYLAAVSNDETPCIMGGHEPWDYYGTARSTSPHWVNRVTALSIRELITADLALGADFISPTPVLFVHGRTDAYCSPEGAQATYDRCGQPKKIVWLDASLHIDLYDNEQYVGPAVDHAVRWFEKYLAPIAVG